MRRVRQDCLRATRSPDERGLQAYAHIDASGMLRASSYSPAGAKIGDAGVLSALERLRNTFEIKCETQS